jgi:acyl dehydratase
MAETPSSRFSSVQVGATLPPLVTAPISRLTLALYCGASGDHNPIHVDLDFARTAGQPDVIAHGMLSMAYLARLLTNWAPQHQLRSFNTRFVAITHVGDVITCTGRVVEKLDAGSEHRVRLELATANQHGETKLTGEATIALP